MLTNRSVHLNKTNDDDGRSKVSSVDFFLVYSSTSFFNKAVVKKTFLSSRLPCILEALKEKKNAKTSDSNQRITCTQ